MCYLQNDTDTPKYGIEITGDNFATKPTRIDFIGPNRHTEFEVLTDVNEKLSVGVTWHQREDLTDVVRGQMIDVADRAHLYDQPGQQASAPDTVPTHRHPVDW